MSKGDLILIPLSLLTHPQSLVVPSLLTAAAEYGGIPIPVSPVLFADCCRLASRLGLDLSDGTVYCHDRTLTRSEIEASAFFRDVHAAAQGEVSESVRF